MNTSKEFVSRLLKYRNVIMNLKKLGIIKVFSDNLGDASGTTSSQVRKDFSQLEITGNKRGGYNIDHLIERLNAVLGENTPHKVILAGCGNIGRAMIEFNGYHNTSLEIVAGFDTAKNIINEDASVPIFPIEKMPEYIAKHKIKVGIIAVPESAATEIYEKMVQAGIKGVLNFARVHIREIDDTVINTVNIELQIENLFYFVNVQEKNNKKS